MPSPKLHLDFETFSRAPLKVCGGYRYAQDPSTEILCCAWAIDEEIVRIWVPCITREQARQAGMPLNKFWHYGRAVPNPLADAVQSGIAVYAHNAQFERAIWQAIVVRKHGGPPIRREQFHCTAAMAAAANLPRSLGEVGMALDTKQQKDKEGDRLLKLFAMPRKPSKKDDRTRVMPLDSPSEFKSLCDYCIQDVRTERDIDKLIPPLHPSEQKLYTFDMLINERGLLLDIPKVRKASTVLAHLERNIVADVMARTVSDEYPEGLRPTQRDKMLKFFHSIDVPLENLQADHVRKYLKQNASTLEPLARELLLLRIEAGKSATKKFVSMLAATRPGDYRARGTLLFFGASTGRWCLAEGTLVVTRNGAIPIERINCLDQLWDGTEWVSCEGSIANGEKTVIKKLGVVATGDHLVWETPDRKVPLAEATQIWRSLPPEVNELHANPFFWNYSGATQRTYDVVNAGPHNRFALANGCIVSNSGRIIQPHNFIRGTLKYPEQLKVFELLELADHEVMSLLYEWPITAIGSCLRGFIVPPAGKILRVVDYASIEARVLAWLAGEAWVLKVYESGLNLYKQMAAAVFHIPDAESISKDSNEYKIGKNLVLGCLVREEEVLTRKGWVQLKDLKDEKVWDGVEWVDHEGVINKGYKDIVQVDGVWLTPDHLVFHDNEWVEAGTLSQGSIGHASTCDIVNCGPRHQFMVKSYSGMLLVHNCGYGLGGAKFVAYSEKAGVEITEHFAKQAVKGYRTKHPKIVQFWYDVERCAVTAVREKRGREKAVVLRNLKFFVEDKWLCIQLPVGRCLRYYLPKVVPVEKFGTPSMQLQFKTTFRRRLVSESTYGGKLTENIVQAVARDVLANGMFEAEAHGYPVYGTVHDEIITETDPDFGSVHELEKVVCALPHWATGLPLAAEGFESYRYRK